MSTNVVGQVAAASGNLVSRVGTSVSGLGTTISGAGQSTSFPGATISSVGGVVQSIGTPVSTLGNGLSSGLGQLGTSSDPIGTTLMSVSGVVSDLNPVAGSISNVVTSLTANNSPLTPLVVVTNPAATEINSLGNLATIGGSIVSTELSNSPVQQLTGSLSGVLAGVTGSPGSTNPTAQIAGFQSSLTGFALFLTSTLQNELSGPLSPLAPKTGLISSAVSALTSAPGNVLSALGSLGSQGGLTAVSGSSSAGGLLSPVTSLLGGVSGGSLLTASAKK